MIEKNFVYFISDGADAIKIGYSANIHNRKAGLQGANADQLVILGCIDGDLTTEKHLHTTFAHLRLRGEWFRAAPELLSYIKHVAKEPPPRPDPVPVESIAKLPDIPRKEMMGALAQLLIKDFGSGYDGAVRLARTIDVNVKTAEGWLHGKGGLPQFRHFMTLIQKSDAVLDWLIDSTGRSHWFTESFRPRHLVQMLGATESSEQAQQFMRDLKSLADRRRTAQILGADTSQYDAAYKRLGEIVNAPDDVAAA